MNALRSRNGSVLMVTMILAMAMAATIGSFVLLSLNTLNRSNRFFHGNNSLNVAEAGVEEAMWALNNSFAKSKLTWSLGGSADNPTATRIGNSTSQEAAEFNGGYFSVYIENAFTVTDLVNKIDDLKSKGWTTSQINTWINDHMPVIHARGTVRPGTGPELTKQLRLRLRIRTPWDNGMVGRKEINLNGGDIGSYDSLKTTTVPSNLAAMNYGITVASPTTVVGNVSIGTPADIRGYLSVGIDSSQSAAFLASIKGSLVGATTANGVTVDPNQISYDFNESYDTLPVPQPTSGSSTWPTVKSAGTANEGWVVVGTPGGTTAERFYFSSAFAGSGKNILVVGPVEIVLQSADFDPANIYVLDGTKKIPRIDKTGKVTTTEDTTTGTGDATVWVRSGDIVLNGAPGSLNMDSRPTLLTIYGNDQGIQQDVILNGNANITATVYAPYADVKLNGGGSKGFFAGALVANTITIGGNGYRFIYDESAANEDITGFRLSRWTEFVSNQDPVKY